MSKHLLEDMVRVKHIRKETEAKEMRGTGEIKTNRAKNRPRYMLWSVAFISVVFFVFALSFLFSSAEVAVNPKTKDIVLNENLSASKDSKIDGLSFDLVVISGEENAAVKASGEKDIFQKATGTVVIYNTFSFSPQALSIDTRLEGSNGKIYKTQTKTVVPGEPKTGTPGSVEVKIYGAEAGQEYNSGPLDFKIFGFKGTPKYSKFYARSKGEIAGGFKGKAPAVSDAEKAAAVGNLKTALQTKLLKKAIDQIPGGFVLFKDAIFLDIDDANTPLATKNNELIMTLKGKLYGFLFNEQKLTKKIAENNIEKYDGNEVLIPNIRDLIFSLSGKNNISFDNMKNINFNLSGAAKIIWKLDTNKFTADLLDKSKKDFNQILLRYPNIDSATLTLSPAWKTSIPGQSKDIKMNVNYSK